MKVERSTDNSLGHHFVKVIKDLKDDFHLLKKSSFGVNKETHIQYIDMLNDLFGDILPVKLPGFSLYTVLTQNIVHIMSLETMLVSMYDYPEEFKHIISNLTDDYLKHFELLEKENVLLPSVGGEALGQGTVCYTEDLPGYNVLKSARLKQPIFEALWISRRL